MTASSRGSLALLALAVAAFLPACLGDGATPSPQSTPGASPTADQQSGPQAAADLAAALDLQRYGQYEEALAVYRRIVQVDDAETSLQARYGLAQTYLALGQYTRAIDEIDGYLDSKPPTEDALRAHFLLGRAHAALGDIDKAQDALHRYAEGQGPLALDAHLEIADLHAQAGRHDKALDELESALELFGASLGSVPPSLAATFYLNLAQSYRETGEPAMAIGWYERLLQESPSDTLTALALSELAGVSRQVDDRPRWRQALLQLVETYPESAQAPNALQELLAAGETVDALTGGLVHLHQEENAEAAAIFDGILQGEPPPSEAAAAHYYRGVIHEHEEEPHDALADYEASLALDPPGDLADDAAWNRALILEELWLTQDAATAYQELWRSYPASPFAADAAIACGRLLYQIGDPLGASAAWHEALPTLSDREHVAQAHRWLGKADQVLGDAEGAAAHFQQAMDAAPDSFYALRAEALLAGQGATAPPSGPSDRIQAAVIPSTEAPQAWLTSTFGPENVLLEPSPFAQPGWLRGQEYARIGFLRAAHDEFLSLIDESASRPWSLYRLARAFHDQGLTHLATRAAATLLVTFAGPLEDVPPSLLELAYPQDFMPSINAAAAENDLSPLVLLAMIRQESSFDPAAGSPAGALGLTQIIPTTAQEIAQQLGRQDFSTTDLFRPSVSIEFGAHYLASQVQLFEGNLYFALAAYNAGPGRALAWSQEAAGDPDLFQELIQFAETRTYVKIVLENYAVYRFLYAEADHITLLAAPAP